MKLEDHYHICTEGLENRVLFLNRRHFIYGMNGVAVCAVKYNVRILAFCLMNNHSHFVVHAPEDACEKFITSFQKRLKKAFKGYDAEINIFEVTDRNYLITVIGYVLRNPYGAKIPILPTNYEWGSGTLYYQSEYFFHKRRKENTTLGDMTIEQQRHCLRSKTTLPEHFLVNAEGMVLPECYVDVRAVHDLFGSLGWFLTELARNKDMETELTQTKLPKSRYTDEQASASAREICIQKYGVADVGKLSIDNLQHLAVEMRKRYRLGAKQLARVTHLDLRLLKKVLQEPA